MVLTELETPIEDEGSTVGATEPGGKEQTERMRELETLLEAGNTRALSHLPWLQRCVDTEAPDEARALLRQIEALDFPAALRTLHGLKDGIFAGIPGSAEQRQRWFRRGLSTGDIERCNTFEAASL